MSDRLAHVASLAQHFSDFSFFLFSFRPGSPSQLRGSAAVARMSRIRSEARRSRRPARRGGARKTASCSRNSLYRSKQLLIPPHRLRLSPLNGSFRRVSSVEFNFPSNRILSMESKNQNENENKAESANKGRERGSIFRKTNDQHPDPDN